MCSVRLASRVPAKHTTALAFALVCVTASGLSAQDAEQYRAKVERLAAHLEAVREQVLAEVSAESPVDTIRVGRLRFLVRSERQVFLAEVADITWDSLAAALGVDTLLIPESYLYLHLGGDPRPGLPSEVGRYLIRDPEDSSDVAAGLTQFILSATWEGLDADLVRWLRSPSGLDSLSRIQAEVVYVELATAPWERVKLCRAGDLEACGRVLGLETADDTVSLWYTVEDQRRAVERIGAHPGRDIRTSSDYIDCTNGDDTACSALLNQWMWLIGEPLSATARGSILQVALEIGGDGALGRLARSAAPTMGARLSVAAGVPSDSLIARWRERILAAAPAQVILTGATGGTALVWVLLLAFLALRSTRWRDP
jgi:hypothetical protein